MEQLVATANGRWPFGAIWFVKIFVFMFMYGMGFERVPCIGPFVESLPPCAAARAIGADRDGSLMRLPLVV